MQKEKIVIATILYKPGIEVWLRIKLALENGYRVYIFDNSPNTTHCPVNISSSPNLRYFTLGSNVGIGTALRQICATAYFEHNEYLLYFDQDTVFSSDTVAYISSFCAVVEDRGTFSDDRLARLSSVTFRDRKSTSCRAKIDVSGYSLQIVDFTINSGALFFLKRLKKIGWHDPKFFIDGVDYSYCLAAAAAGYTIAELDNTPGLNHSIEQDDAAYNFLGLIFVGRRYPIYRRRDFLVSSTKLIFRALRIDARMTLWLMRSFAIFCLAQMIIPFSRTVPK